MQSHQTRSGRPYLHSSKSAVFIVNIPGGVVKTKVMFSLNPPFLSLVRLKQKEKVLFFQEKTKQKKKIRFSFVPFGRKLNLFHALPQSFQIGAV